MQQQQPFDIHVSKDPYMETRNENVRLSVWSPLAWSRFEGEGEV